jgi:lysophospholipase L1-like esterase
MKMLFALVKSGFYGAFLLLLVSCSSEQELQPLKKNSVIVAFGDSLTEGVGASRDQSYPQVLAELSGITVINSGVSGETTAEGLDRLPLVLGEHKPDLVILMEGGNDILRNLSHIQAKENLAQMIQIVRLSGAQVVLLGVPEKNLFSNSADFYDQLAKEQKVVFDGETMSDLLKTRSYKSDTIHLNNKGYRELANRIYSLLQEHGAL